MIYDIFNNPAFLNDSVGILIAGIFDSGVISHGLYITSEVPIYKLLI